MQTNPDIFIKKLFIILTFTLPLNVFADCKDDCKQSSSCTEYVTCQVAETECIAACTQAEAYDKLAASSGKVAAAQIKALEEFTEALRKVTASFNNWAEKLSAKQED